MPRVADRVPAWRASTSGRSLHGDHFGDLPFLILDGQFAHRTRPLHVAGPAGVGERVEAAMEVLFPGQIRRCDVWSVLYVLGACLLPLTAPLVGG